MTDTGQRVRARTREAASFSSPHSAEKVAMVPWKRISGIAMIA
jgi:hypothetical protein